MTTDWWQHEIVIIWSDPINSRCTADCWLIRMISGDLPSSFKYFWSTYTTIQSSVRQIDQFIPSFIAQISNSRTVDDDCFIRKYFHTLPSFPLSVCYLFLECRMQITNWGGLQTGIANAIRRLRYIVVGLRGRYVQVRFFKAQVIVTLSR